MHIKLPFEKLYFYLQVKGQTRELIASQRKGTKTSPSFTDFILVKSSVALSECKQSTKEALGHWGRELHLSFIMCSEFIHSYLLQHSQTYLSPSSLESSSLPNYTLKQKGSTKMAQEHVYSIFFRCSRIIQGSKFQENPVSPFWKIQDVHFRELN